MDDREVAVAIARADPVGIAEAYDRYAANLYGYCHSMLHQPADAAEALRDTFVVTAATLGDLPEPPKLRPWLYSVAREECQRRHHILPPIRGEETSTADQPATSAGQPAEVGRDPAPAELETLIRRLLAEMKPREREVLELSLRHDLDDGDLAIALGVSWSRAHTLISRARGRLEKTLAVLLVARTGRQACPTLDTLLADWDGQLAEQTRDLVGMHIEQCETCLGSNPGTLRPAALSRLLPLAVLPPGLREQVLRDCYSTSPDAVNYRLKAARRAESVWLEPFSRTVKRWGGGGGRSRPATATVILGAWIVAVWAVSIALLIVTGAHPSRALVLQPSSRNLTSSPVATTSAPIAPTSAPTSASAKPSPVVSRAPADVTPSAALAASPTERVKPSPSAKPSRSPKPSKSPKPSPSPSPSKSPSPSPSPSPSTTA